MKVLVLGGEGMLGHKMFQVLNSRYPDIACTVMGSLREPFFQSIDLFNQGNVIEKVNAMDIANLGNRLRQLCPQFIVNCIGIVKQRGEARDPILSITLNSLLPHKLAEFARDWGGRVIHFSTDCVFSGERGSYSEEDESDAKDLYGKSKFLGEVTSENALTLRTSIIGRELAQFQSLLEWFLSQRNKTVRGFTRVIYAGVTTNYLAQLVGNLITDYPELSGLYQVTSPAISKHDLLCMLRDEYNLSVEIIPDDQEFSDRSMVGEKFIETTGYSYPNWPSLAAQLANDRTPYEKWRSARGRADSP
jgi:dTDP-4-dehydrorhamnose reductase